MAEAISRSLQKVWMASVAVPVVYLVAQPKFSDVLPEIRLPLLFLAALSINWTTWFIWYAFLWPNFFSPLRHLPTPQEVREHTSAPSLSPGAQESRISLTQKP
jgi:hypothetical protein